MKEGVLASENSVASQLQGEIIPFHLIAAPFTPLSADGAPRMEIIAPYAEWLAQQGVNGVFVNGTTGEGMSLTVADRKSVLEAWKEALPEGIGLLAHVGHACLEDAEDLARHAGELGVDGFSSIGPIFFAPSSVAAFVAMNQRIAAAAPDTPFYVYHMPAMSRQQMPVCSWWQTMTLEVSNFRGVKFTHEDIQDFAEAVHLAGDNREVFFGRDEMLLRALKVGARSAVGSTYNFATPIYRAVIAAFQSGDSSEAERLQKLAADGIQEICACGGLAGLKAVLTELSGLELGPVSLPLESPSRAEIHRLVERLKDSGYLEALQASPEEAVAVL